MCYRYAAYCQSLPAHTRLPMGPGDASLNRVDWCPKAAVSSAPQYIWWRQLHEALAAGGGEALAERLLAEWGVLRAIRSGRIGPGSGAPSACAGGQGAWLAAFPAMRRWCGNESTVG